MKKLLNHLMGAALIIMLGFGVRNAQAYQSVFQNWVANYGGPGWDQPYDMVVDPVGNVYVVGAKDSQYAVVKFSPSGVFQWERLLGTGYAKAAALSADGCVCVTGIGGSDYLTVKYDANGQLREYLLYDNFAHGSDYAQDIAVDADGNMFVTGSCDSILGENSECEYVTIKYGLINPHHRGFNQLWVARYTYSPGFQGGRQDCYGDFAYAIAVDADGNAYVTGHSWGGSATDRDCATLKYRSDDGYLLWEKRFNGGGYDGGNAIAMDPSGSVYVTGLTDGGLSLDYITLKYRCSDGFQEGCISYDGPSHENDEAVAIAIDGNHNVFVTGSSDSLINGFEYADYLTVKYNSNLVQQWARRYNGPPGNGHDIARRIVVDTQGNCYVTGESPGNGTGNDYATMKYNPSGVRQWVMRYNGGGNGDDRAVAIWVNASQEVYVTGWSDCLPGLPSNINWITIKYGSGLYAATDNMDSMSPGNNLTINEEVTQPKACLLSNHPEPFNPSTTISFKLQAASRVDLRVYDTSGRLVTTLVEGWRDAGEHQITFDGSNLPSGIYLARLTAREYTAVQKLVLLK